jgi:hypothetical protein
MDINNIEEEKIKEVLKSKTINELRELAIKSTNVIVQKILSDSVDVSIRRNLSLNKNINREIINKLAFDVTINVVYCALNNPNCTEKRVLSDNDKNHKCVKCEIDIQYIKCSQCVGK